MNLPFFAVKAYVPGGVQNQAEKKSKNAFRPVPVQKFTFPGHHFHGDGTIATKINTYPLTWNCCETNTPRIKFGNV